VVPGDSDRSYLAWKVTGDGRGSCCRMPPGNPLSSAEIADLIAWIDAGAANN
jgi:hypothetical protein